MKIAILSRGPGNSGGWVFSPCIAIGWVTTLDDSPEQFVSPNQDNSQCDECHLRNAYILNLKQRFCIKEKIN